MSNKRIIAAIIDFAIATVINAVCMFVFVLLPSANQSLEVDDNFVVRAMMVSMAGMLYLLLRDVLGSRSIGKIIMKLQIVDKSTGDKASFGQRFLRNITWVISWIEIIVFLANNGNRLGDMLAKTRVEEMNV
ncbi:MAG: RDD family protein [Spirochaetales bacterium]|nr:RDD family protein [Spirochaetales bacterium]